MTSAADLRAEVEDFLRGGAINNSQLEVDKARYRASLADTPWTAYVQRADYSYFTARVLLAQYVHLYGLFCAHQCVEVYLKAYLKMLGAPVPQMHGLEQLLAQARQIAPVGAEFISEPEAETICARYDPFYELARYPAQISRPERGQYVWASSLDEQILDYFVFRMRRLLPLPEKSWDILSEHGHYDLDVLKEQRPDVWRFFVARNANLLP